MIAPTYCLRGENGSGDYYRSAESLAEKVVSQADGRFGSLITGYCDWQQRKGSRDIRTQPEYVLELLTLGTLWNIYGRGSELPHSVRKLLVAASIYRKRHNLFRNWVDIFRGVMTARYLIRKTQGVGKAPTLQDFRLLLVWLSATGEFVQEYKRLRGWYRYLRECTSDCTGNFFTAVVEFASWFDQESSQKLAAYTLNVDSYLQQELSMHHFREDYLFCGRMPVEYHLNLVGAEILNKAYRGDFLKTKKRVILLPSCLRLAGNACQALRSDTGFVCAGCNDRCKVKQITEFSERYCYSVFTVEHESEVFRANKARELIGEQVGVIGVACALNLVANGWKAKEQGIAVQCVVLDYCGCKKHWHATGISTDLDDERLRAIMGI